MNNKAFTVSLLLAATAVFLVHSYTTSKEESYTKTFGNMVPVVVAKKTIKEMDEITKDAIEIVNKPKNYVEPGKTTSKEEVEGFIAAVNIRKGEQVTLNKVIPPGVQTGLSRQVAPGRRAIAIPVDDYNAVNRLLKPGDRVDLIATIDPPGAPKGSQIARTVLQDVLVLAVGEWVSTTAPRKTEKDEIDGKNVTVNLNITRNFNTITLEVEPYAAQQLTLLRSSGITVGVVLRNNDDSEKLVIRGVGLPDVLGDDVSRVPVRTPGGSR